MAYNANIPNATDRISDSQAPIKANFTAIDTVVSVNHVTFDDASGDQGKHLLVTLPRKTVAPIDPTTGATEVALFAKLSTLGSTETELFFARQNGGDIIEFTSAAKSQDGWTILPSGILLKWMYVADLRGNVTSSWPTGATIPIFSSIFNVQVTADQSGTSDSDVALRTSAKTATTVRTYGSKRTTSGAATSSLGGYIFGIGSV